MKETHKARLKGMIMHHDTISPSKDEESILTKIRMLPPDRIAEIADFVDFISQKDQERQPRQAAGKISEEAFKKVWDNCEDDVYDRL